MATSAQSACPLALRRDERPRLAEEPRLAEKKNPRHRAGGYGFVAPCRQRPAAIALSDLEVLRRRTAAIGDELVLDCLALVEAGQARPLDRRDMDEHILIASRWTNKPVALSWIEPFDGALLHRRVS